MIFPGRGRREWKLLRGVIHDLFDEAALRLPEEACGLLELGDEGMVAHPCRNVAERPTESFLIAPAEQRELLKAIFDRGSTWWGVYHSHPPPGDATPSARDRKFMAALPRELRFVILGRPGTGEESLWCERCGS